MERHTPWHTSGHIVEHTIAHIRARCGTYHGSHHGTHHATHHCLASPASPLALAPPDISHLPASGVDQMPEQPLSIPWLPRNSSQCTPDQPLQPFSLALPLHEVLAPGSHTMQRNSLDKPGMALSQSVHAQGHSPKPAWSQHVLSSSGHQHSPSTHLGTTSALHEVPSCGRRSLVGASLNPSTALCPPSNGSFQPPPHTHRPSRSLSGM